MNNEPVAWMYACNGVWTAFSDELPPDDAYDEGTLTPLYTHPVELTDEEIYEILWKNFPISDKEANANFIAVMTHCVRLALRKALRKAQEK